MKKVLLYCLVIGLVTMILSSTINEVYAVKATIRKRIVGYDDAGPIYEEETTYEVTAGQLLAIGVIVILKILVKCPEAFFNIGVPSGWTYTTDGETYIRAYPPTPIEEYGVYGPISWYSRQGDVSAFYWETRDVIDKLLETGTFISEDVFGGVGVPVDKLGLLAPYIGLASTILVATAATAIYVKHVKRRKERQ